MKLSNRLAAAFAVGALAAGNLLAQASSHTEPLGVRIAYGQDPTTQMTFVWHTKGTSDPGTVIEYGPTPSLGQSKTGKAFLTSGLPSSKASTLHEVVLDGLTPASTWYYRVGDGTNWSPIHSFETATPSDEDLRFVMLGDLGISDRAALTLEVVEDLDPDFVLIAGDVSYANSDLTRWDIWAEMAESLGSKVPIMPAAGNHETDTGQTPTHLAYLERFSLPGEELYYSFDIGRIHVLVLHSTVNATTAAQWAAQIPFAEADLADAAMRRDAGELDRIIVVQHHPLYGSQNSSDTERTFNVRMLAWEEKMLHTYDVDLLVAGHNHHYERTTPMAYGQPTEGLPIDGFVEVITGGGGAGLYGFKSSGIAPWSAVREARHHVVLGELSDGVLRFTTIASDGTGDILDEFVIGD